MKIFTEREAENFLEKEGFRVVERVFLQEKSEIKGAVKKIGFPLVMKVSGKKVIHKKKVRGVVDNVKSFEEALEVFRRLRKIEGFEGVMIQKRIQGEEFLLGIKGTPEFGHAIAFGIGGSKVEKLKKVSFRICPFDKKEARDLIREITERKIEPVERNLIELCKLVRKYPQISELDINPLIVNSQGAVIVDARIVFE